MRKINNKEADGELQKEFIESAKRTSEEAAREILLLQHTVTDLEKQLKNMINERDNYKYDSTAAHNRLRSSARQIGNIIAGLPHIPANADDEDVRDRFERLMETFLALVHKLMCCENCAESDKLFPEKCRKCHRRDEWRPKVY